MDAIIRFLQDTGFYLFSQDGNFLLMHAMGPNVAGVIGSAIAAGVLISLYG